MFFIAMNNFYKLLNLHVYGSMKETYSHRLLYPDNGLCELGKMISYRTSRPVVNKRWKSRRP